MQHSGRPQEETLSKFTIVGKDRYMSLETRLRRLEQRCAALHRKPIRIMYSIIDPDPAIGARSVVAFEPGAAKPRTASRIGIGLVRARGIAEWPTEVGPPAYRVALWRRVHRKLR